METNKFKTNIKCAGCVEKVTPHLNEVAGEGQWQVDTNDPAKILTIAHEINATKLNEALAKAGYKAEKL